MWKLVSGWACAKKHFPGFSVIEISDNRLCTCIQLTLLWFSGHVYSIGGQDENDNALILVERFNPESKEWSEVAPMKQARYDAAVVELIGDVYVIGQ